MSKPLVSILILAYNRIDMIGFALESVSKLNYPNIEVIISDDGSDDGTLEFIKNYPLENKVILESETNMGMIYNRIKAVNHAKGKYLLIVDSDDAVFPDILTKQVPLMEANPKAAMVAVRPLLINSKHQIVGAEIDNFNYLLCDRTHKEWARYFFFFGNCISHTGTLIRRSSLEEVGGYDPNCKMLDDFELWMRFAINTYDILAINEPLTFIKKHYHSVTVAGDRADMAYMYYALEKNYFSLSSKTLFSSIFSEIRQDESLDLMKYDLMCFLKNSDHLYMMDVGKKFESYLFKDPQRKQAIEKALLKRQERLDNQFFGLKRLFKKVIKSTD